MSWQPRSPIPPDFCGRPPCPKCYAWAGGSETQSLAQFAFELLGRTPNKAETEQSEKIARRLHREGLSVVAAPGESPPSDTMETVVDIGMTPTEYQTRMLKQMRTTQVPNVDRKFTCDEVADRQAVRDEQAKTQERQREERLKEAREVAKVFADAQRDERRQELQDERYLRDVDPDFVRYMRQRGVTDPREIAFSWDFEVRRNPSYRYMR